MPDKLKISIVIPFYNGDDYYSSLLKSIKNSVSLCDPTLCFFELITIIDSMETNLVHLKDVTVYSFEHCENININVLKNRQNIGVAASRNFAMSIATGNYFHMIDQDDEVNELFYKSIIPLAKDYDFILINGLINYKSDSYNSHLLYYISPKLNIRHFLTNEFIRSPGQVVFSKDIIKNTLFPEPSEYKGTDDRFFWIRLFLYNKQIKTYYLREPLYIANIHNENYSADSLNLRKSSLENWKILKAETDISAYERMIKRDILSLEFAANQKMPLIDKLIGSLLRAINFLEPNKMIRFFFKRVKW